MLKLMFLAIMRTLWLVIITWIQLVRDISNWHINMFWRFIMWTVSVTTLPFRALGALQREKMMQRLMQEMQSGLENLALDNKKLRAHLHMVVEDHHQMESILAELEEDHDNAIAKIELLESEVKHLKAENQRPREVQSKGHWDPTAKTNPREDNQTTFDPDEKEIEAPPKHPSSSSRAKKRSSGTLSNPTTLINPLTSPLSFSSNVDPDATLNQQRKNALSQSIFSAMLSLLVGTIIWEAKDPCVPLVMALFTVVGLSLRSVVVFFSTIQNKPASDAVALLSVNWFILGTLAYPILPSVAQVLSPFVVSSVVRFIGWLGPSIL